jgi:hypothetical protein
VTKQELQRCVGKRCFVSIDINETDQVCGVFMLDKIVNVGEGWDALLRRPRFGDRRLVNVERIAECSVVVL